MEQPESSGRGLNVGCSASSLPPRPQPFNSVSGWSLGICISGSLPVVAAGSGTLLLGLLPQAAGLQVGNVQMPVWLAPLAVMPNVCIDNSF